MQFRDIQNPALGLQSPQSHSDIGTHVQYFSYHAGSIIDFVD